MKQKVYNASIKCLAAIAVALVCFYKQSFMEVLFLAVSLGLIAMMAVLSICDAMKSDYEEKKEDYAEQRVEEAFDNAEYHIHSSIVFRGFK